MLNSSSPAYISYMDTHGLFYGATPGSEVIRGEGYLTNSVILIFMGKTKFKFLVGVSPIWYRDIFREFALHGLKIKIVLTRLR
jgi:hypothetical protein